MRVPVTTTVIAAAVGRRRADPDVARASAVLTARDRETAVLMARGLSNAGIDALMRVSLTTVKVNLTRVFSKLGVDNRVSARWRSGAPASSTGRVLALADRRGTRGLLTEDRADGPIAPTAPDAGGQMLRR